MGVLKSIRNDESSHARLLGKFVLQVWPLLLGNVLEWYEYAIYGFLVPQVTANFFHGSASAAWLGFAVNFVVRPVGGFVFGWAADRYGRRKATVVSVLGMMVATVGQGLLPSSYCCGPAAGRVGTVLIMTLRGMQGFCTGGESAAILPYIAEIAPGQIKCTAASMFMLTLCVAFFLGSSFAFLLTLLLDEAHMMLWGWRIPFLVCLIPGTVSLWGRQNLPESPEFLEWQENQKQRLDQQKHEEQQLQAEANLVRSCWQRARSFCDEHAVALIVVFFGTASGGLGWNQALWSLSYARANGLSGLASLGVGSAMQVVVAVTVVVGAMVSDKKELGPYPAMLLGTSFLGLAWAPLFGFMTAFPGDPCIAFLCASLGFGVCLGLQLATFHFYFVTRFPMRVRGRLFGVTWNISLAIFGGFAGAISQGLLSITPIGPPLYVSAAAMVSLATLLWGKWAEAHNQLRHAAQRQEANQPGMKLETGQLSA